MLSYEYLGMILSHLNKSGKWLYAIVSACKALAFPGLKKKSKFIKLHSKIDLFYLHLCKIILWFFAI